MDRTFRSFGGDPKDPLDQLGRPLKVGDLVHLDPGTQLAWKVQDIKPNIHPKLPPGSVMVQLTCFVPVIARPGEVVGQIVRVAEAREVAGPQEEAREQAETNGDLKDAVGEPEEDEEADPRD